MGLVPGVEVRVVTIAPLGDPLRIEVRGGQWSIRRAEAAEIEVAEVARAHTAPRAEPIVSENSPAQLTARVAAATDTASPPPTP